MAEDKFNYEKSMVAMTIRWIDSLSFLNDDEKVKLLKVATIIGKRRNDLFELYDAILNKREIREDEEKLISYEICDELHKIKLNDIVLTFSEENIKKVISTIVDLNEDVLPLGSVVTLKNLELNKDVDEDRKFVITHRFLTNKNMKTYYTYGGVLYPVGIIDNEKILHFNSSAIKQNIHIGFSDEMDQTFIVSMKNELIVKREMHSINFSTVEERKSFFEETR